MCPAARSARPQPGHQQASAEAARKYIQLHVSCVYHPTQCRCDGAQLHAPTPMTTPHLPAHKAWQLVQGHQVHCRADVNAALVSSLLHLSPAGQQPEQTQTDEMEKAKQYLPATAAQMLMPGQSCKAAARAGALFSRCTWVRACTSCTTLAPGLQKRPAA
jgi:hypothetical protein